MERQKTVSDGALLRGALSALMRRMRREDDPVKVGDVGIGPTGIGLLALLHQLGPASAGQLAESEGFEPQSLTRPLQALEDAGLIERRVDEDDRRRSILAITDEGAELLRATMRKRAAWLNREMQQFNEDERATLRDAALLMERLAGRERRESSARVDQVFNLIPFADVRDVRTSIAFYARLGFVVDGEMTQDDELVFASMHAKLSRPARIMFRRACDPIQPKEQRVLFYCWTEELDALHARLTGEGLAPGPIERPEPMREGEFHLTDPDGFCIVVGEVVR
jgi:DNA-binding MarR family transcriptional regulator